MTTTEIMNNTQQSHKRLSTTQNPHVKFCGMTREQDIELAVELGVNAVGMILVPGTARGISPQLARQLNSAIPEHVISVVVVRNQSVDEVRHIIDEVQLIGDKAKGLLDIVLNCIRLMALKLPATILSTKVLDTNRKFHKYVNFIGGY